VKRKFYSGKNFLMRKVPETVFFCVGNAPETSLFDAKFPETVF
jgi:hypothetical protein